MEHASDPYVNALYAPPLVAVIPVIVVWFGFQTTAKVVLVFLFCVFPVLINTFQGVKNTDARLVEVARSFCSSEWRFSGQPGPAALLPVLFFRDSFVVGARVGGVGGEGLAALRQRVGLLFAHFPYH